MPYYQELIPIIRYEEVIGYEPVKNPDSVKLIYFDPKIYKDNNGYNFHVVWKRDVDFQKLDESIKENRKKINKDSFIYLLPLSLIIITFFYMIIGKVLNLLDTSNLYDIILYLFAIADGITSAALRDEIVGKRKSLLTKRKLKFMDKHRDEINKMYEDVSLLGYSTDMFNTYNNRTYPLSKEHFLNGERLLNLFVLNKRLKKLTKKNKDEIEHQKELLSKFKKVENPKEEVEVLELPKEKEEIKEEKILDELNAILDQYNVSPSDNTNNSIKNLIKK